jgi:hypothetical protein
MVATDVPPSRLAVAQRTTRRFLDGLPKGYRVGMVSFAQAASTVLPATSNRMPRSARSPPCAPVTARRSGGHRPRASRSRNASG